MDDVPLYVYMAAGAGTGKVCLILVKSGFETSEGSRNGNNYWSLLIIKT